LTRAEWLKQSSAPQFSYRAPFSQDDWRNNCQFTMRV